MVASLMALATCLGCKLLIFRTIDSKEVFRQAYFNTKEFKTFYSLTGIIPPSVRNATKLLNFGLSGNRINGNIPKEIEGEIPLFITNASKLEILELQNNFITGTISNNLENLRELQELFLYNNQLTNEPREHDFQFFNSLEDCRMLQYLQAGSNPLNGFLPNSIGNLSFTIVNIHMEDAHISDFIPASTGNMSDLTALIFHENNLTGSIPSEIGKLKHLQGLSLSNNKLQGHIPEIVCSLSNLVALDIDNNEFSGSIPECLGNLSKLQEFFLISNRSLSSKFPSSLWKMSGYVSQNSIEGEVPQDIGGLKAILELDLSSNNF
ncbi:hypothetical protein HAX54_018219 [Datura stramonium]|uniref:Disease resistance R13L4/SHOC-2-like LRR domain-containing protein n=1 Tax=Datura stramonium TaxID=4076 RepID=A0ABS8UM09_DATST|nr:hypothetical protein [Datura stramonium]